MTSDEIRSAMSSLEFHYDDVLEDVQLESARSSVASTEKSIHALDERLKKLRQRGYVFDSTLEDRISDVQQRWRQTAPRIQREITNQTRHLQNQVAKLKSRMAQLRRYSTPPMSQIKSLAADVDDVETEIESAQRAIDSLYEALSSEARALENQIYQVEWLFEQLDTAKFTLMESEAPVAACKAIWARDGEEEQKGDPAGILYLTDQRLFFERKEKVATKKVLFIATEKKLVHELLLEAPIALIERAEAEDKGFAGKDDYIILHFASGAPHAQLAFHIWGSNKQWVSLIRRIQQDDLDRTVPVDAEAEEKVRNAPSQCPSCGATLDQVILRGQDTLTCEYCGYVIRL